MTIPKHILSKSTFLRGCQCHKSLYLYKHFYNLRDEISAEQQAIFDRGTNVGELAQDLFSGGINCKPDSPFEYQKSVLKTQEAIQNGEKIIYEAAFQFDGVLAAIDILVQKRGEWYAYEVKSSTSVTETYIKDAALQYYVITNAGIALTDISIVHINNQYVRHGALNIKELFTIESVKEAALGLQKEIALKITVLKKIVKQKKQCPAVDIGAHCYNPYDCDFHGYCWKHIPEESVFDLRGNGGFDRAMKLYQQGILKLTDIPSDLKLNAAQRTQVDTHISQQLLINKPEIKKFLKTLTYPLYFMDFETFTSAIPEYGNTKPFQQIPFQFSLHILVKPDGTLQHKEFLAETGKDPRIDFITALLLYIGTKGSVVVYNQTFESRILNEIAVAFPKYKSKISAIQSRMLDLMTPFRKKHYYHHKMKGSYSIKYVLPALIPELKYDDLDISNGGMASQTFANLQHETDTEKIKLIRQQLLEYCGLDTLAMVKILNKLSQL